MLGLVLLWALGLFHVSFGCSSTNKTCEKICRDLDTCGLLPSVLGAESGLGGDGSAGDSRLSCYDRCENSTPELQHEFGKCKAVERVKADIPCAPTDYAADAVGNWCCRYTCEDFARCMDGVAGPMSRPHGAIAVGFSAVDEGGEPVKPIDSAFRAACSDTVAPLVPFPDAANYCASARLGLIRTFVEVEGVVTSSELTSCESALTAGQTFDDLPAGRAVVWAEFVAFAPGATSPTCGVFWSRPAVVLPGRMASAYVRLPSADATGCPATATDCTRYECENSEETCSDDKDNDGDGRLDCQGYRCKDTAICRSAPG